MPKRAFNSNHEKRAEDFGEAAVRLDDAGHFISEIVDSLEQNGQGVVAGQWQDCLVELENLQAKMARLAR